MRTAVARRRRLNSCEFSHQGPATTGFTLLELLIATALSVVLLAGLWGLLRIYSDLFDKGQAKTERSQLVRSLLEQISEDLRSAIQDPISGTSEPPRGTSFITCDNEMF